MFDVEADVSVGVEDTSAGEPASASELSAEDKLKTIRTAEIELLVDHLLEELTAVERALPRGDDYPDDRREAQVQGAGERSG